MTCLGLLLTSAPVATAIVAPSSPFQLPLSLCLSPSLITFSLLKLEVSPLTPNCHRQTGVFPDVPQLHNAMCMQDSSPPDVIILDLADSLGYAPHKIPQPRVPF